jgi:hypothetical protein
MVLVEDAGNYLQFMGHFRVESDKVKPNAEKY